MVNTFQSRKDYAMFQWLNKHDSKVLELYKNQYMILPIY